MPEEIIGTFNVKRLSVLDENGVADASLMPQLPDEEIKKTYELMLLVRTFDRIALDLQREGRIGTYASVYGQEASQIGSALALRNATAVSGPAEKGVSDPWVFPSFREMAVFITLGYPMRMLFQYWSGDERGMNVPEDKKIFPLCIPVGTQVPHAVGAAMGMKYRGDRSAVAVYFGDGGTSKGDFHEGLNMAGVFKLPVVFICQNNQWAISVPRERQSAASTLAQKALAYGFDGVQVDGNDLFAVYRATRVAVERAVSGGGPTLIECFTYRLSDHTTADDAARYRGKEEVEKWLPKDPARRLRLYMEEKGLWSKAFEEDALKRASAAVDEAVKEAEGASPPSPSDMFTYTYKDMPRRLERQMREGGWR